jgi:hypothetical protein
VLAKLSTCDVDVQSKLKVKTQNSIISGTMILPHEQQQKQGNMTTNTN